MNRNVQDAGVVVAVFVLAIPLALVLGFWSALAWWAFEAGWEAAL